MYEIIGELIAFIVSVFVFRSLSVTYKLLAIHAILSFLVEFTGFIMRKNYINSQWLFNCYMISDCGLLLLAGYYFKLRLSSLFLIIGFLIFLTVWSWNIYSSGMSEFPIPAHIVNSILQVGTYLFILYQTTVIHKESLIQSPAFWICLGIILFFGCSIPFFSLLGFLAKNAREILDRLSIVLKILIAVRYLLLSVGLLIYYKQSRIFAHASQ